MIRSRALTVIAVTAAALLSLSPSAWAGTGWRTTTTPNFGANGTYQSRPLNGVAASSRRNAWAIGGYGTSTADILHWNGSKWSKAKIPAPADHTGSLVAIAEHGARTAYAVGYQGTGNGGGLWLLHYNGRSWSDVNTTRAPTTVDVYGIAVASIHHVWIVGYDSTSPKAVAIEWRSPGWTVTHPPLPRGTTGAELNAVGFIPGTTKVIAVGYTYNSAYTEFPYAVRYVGGAWHRLRTPSSPAGPLRALAVLSNNNAWAVGTREFSNSFQTLVEHWNGTKWSVVRSSNRSGASNTLLGVAAVSSSDLMAVGYSCAGSSCTTRTLTEQWNGHRWSIVSSRNPYTAKGDVDEFFATTAVPKTHGFWGVGEDGPARPGNFAEFTLAERYNL